MKQQSVKTTCSYCGVGCGIEARKDFQENVTVTGDKRSSGEQRDVVFQRNEFTLCCQRHIRSTLIPRDALEQILSSRTR